MFEWEKFEEFVRHLTIEDGTKRTPLSGATKQEEDVVGNTLICQCKQTDDKNFSILEKDFSRLLESAKLLEKFPLFFSCSKAGKLMSIPLVEGEETESTIEDLIKFLIVEMRILALYKFCRTVDNDKTLFKAKKEFVALTRLEEDSRNYHKRLLERIRNRLACIEDDLTMYNLFDEHPNELQK